MSTATGIRHGTIHAYRRHGCRCDDCTAARRAEGTRRRSRPIPPDMEHGVVATYLNYGCRCEPCRAAQATRMARYRREHGSVSQPYRKRGEPQPKVPREVVRQAAILARCEPDDYGCWIWTGRKSRDGRGKYRNTTASRMAYMAFVGPIGEGLDLDHLCENGLCVNPEHLEPVTPAENLQRLKRSRVWRQALLAALAVEAPTPTEPSG